MRAVVCGAAAPPRLDTFTDPVDDERWTAVAVRAAALTNLDVAVASGRHYFSARSGTSVVGREAVVSLSDGKRMFLNAIAISPPFGSMAERTLADPNLGLPVPDGVPDEVAAVLGNAGLAAWLPLSWRARLAEGERVLVLGATGVTGRIAVAAAKQLGAGRVVAAGRNRHTLERLLSSGADAVVSLEDEELARGYVEAAEGNVDVVLDYLGGRPAEAAINAMATGARMVQIGSALAPGIMLNAQAARRASLDVLGFAYYHAPIEEQRAAYRALCTAALQGLIRVPLTTLPLSRFEEAWNAQTAGTPVRYVLKP